MRFKKLLAVILSVMILFVVIPFATFTVSATKSGTTGDCTWSLDGTVLNICGNGTMANYSYSNWAPWGTDITKVVVENGVTNIGEFAFAYCTKLTDIIMPESIVNIGAASFDSCSSLTTIDFPDNILYIGNGAFYGCTSFQNLLIPNGTIYIDDYAFENCTKLNTIILPDSIKSIGTNAFYNTKIYNNTQNWENYVLYIGNHLIAAESNKISGSYFIKNNTLTIADSAFEECYNLKYIVLPKGIITIGNNAFYRCILLSSITIPDSVKSIGYSAFQNCENLVSIKIPDKMTTINECTFWGCTSLKSIVLPNGVKNIDKYAFYYCTSLISVTIPNSVTNINIFAFSDCNSLTDVCYNGNKQEWNSICIEANNNSLASATVHLLGEPFAITDFTYTISNGGVILDRYNGTGWNGMIPETIEGYPVTRIGNRAFSGYYLLPLIIIPDSVTSIGYDVFLGCTDLNIYCNTGSISELLLTAGYSHKCFGDFDNDKKLSSSDIVAMRKSLLGKYDENYDEKVADLNQDNDFNVLDLVRLKKKLAGIIA